LIQELRSILGKRDCQSDSFITRAKSVKHADETEVLIQHVRILVEDLLHENQSQRNEIFYLRNLIEDPGDDYYEQL